MSSNTDATFYERSTFEPCDKMTVYYTKDKDWPDIYTNIPQMKTYLTGNLRHHMGPKNTDWPEKHGGAIFLACEDFVRMFDHSFLICDFFFFFWSGD